jgi:hypothetical protein
MREKYIATDEDRWAQIKTKLFLYYLCNLIFICGNILPFVLAVRIQPH